MRISLSNLPDPPKEYVIDFSRLDGGLNTWELDYRLDANESPEMKNLWWEDGALCCRDGQDLLTGDSPGRGYSASEALFWDHGFFHIGTGLYCGELSDPDAPSGSLELKLLLEGVPENRGSWFRYGDGLYYKNRGGYYCIKYDADTGGFTAGEVEAYSPIIQINTEPSTAAGDVYQPENRLNPQKTVWYTSVEGVLEYHLPVQEVGSVDRVEVDDVELPQVTMEELAQLWAAQEGETGSEGEETPTATCWAADLEKGIVWFDAAPKFHDPVQVNTVKLTYTKGNADAYSSVMDCPYAVTYGGDQELCVVVGGCPAQPNAYFWCGNHIVMDPGYFPMEQYNLAGDTEEFITGFGKQQAMLVIFKEHSVGRASMSTTEMDSGRVLITMDYVSINSRVGCDLPHTIQLIENNLVFCSTRGGVCRIADSSAAYENNILPISRKVDNGLLALVREGADVSSFDDGERYWLTADGQVYAWDYVLSTWKDPSWFYFDNIRGTAYLRTDSAARYHLGTDGGVSVFRRSFADYGKAIHKVYRFATQHMGSYDRLKDVVGAIFVVRGDTDTDIAIEYSTDYESRRDLTPIRAYSWRLVPRNLAYRYLGVKKFATVARRRPGCRHVRHFTMTLSNNTEGTDMSVVSAQIFYKFTGRER